MLSLWKCVYRFFVLPPLWLALQVLGLVSSKARRGIEGRRTLFQDLERQISNLPAGPRVWFHASSLGEFEQAKPIIAELRARRPEAVVIATFFSPSGYEHSRKYHLAHVISYIPFDTHRNACRFLDLVRPAMAVMVRYDIWPNHIWELHRRAIPTMIANATMRRQTKRRIPVIRNFHRHVYNAIDRILTVSAADVEAFGFFGLTHPHIEAIGDTRYDQVSIRSAEARKRSIVPPAILRDRRVLVVGSSWPEDEAVLLPALLAVQDRIPGFLCIVAPHEPTVEHLEDLEEELRGNTTTIRFSALNEYAGERVIVVDSVGILLVLYGSAHLAFVGGSFGKGIHNVLEAAVYGIPVLFGPRHRNSQEPLQLVERGGGFVVTDTADLTRTLEHLLMHEPSRLDAGERAARFVRSNLGATHRVLAHLESTLSHTPPGERTA
jgi:3-deoxy-D-manno-octulosonic-acid transferase